MSSLITIKKNDFNCAPLVDTITSTIDNMQFVKLSRNELLKKCEELCMVKYKSKSKQQLLDMISKKLEALTLKNHPELIIEECNNTLINAECIVQPEEIPIAENLNDSLVIEYDVLQFNKIYNEDCILGMKKIHDDSVDIVICDPPYNIGKDFGNNSDKQKMDEYLSWCDLWIAECLRILKPTGTLYIYGFSEILAYIRTRIYCNVRWLIWHYTNKVTPSLNFWQRTHESILCCSKNKAVFNRDDVREPYTETFLKNAAGKVRKATVGRFSNGDKETTYTAHEGGALPRDVIKIPALAGGAGKKERVDHPTQKPLKLCDTLIKASLNKNAHTLLVVPFAGSGSECVSAKNNNVDFIGFELNSDYINVANERLAENEVV